MKIAVISHLKFPIAKPFAGGLEAFTHGYVQQLCKRGHDVTLFASADSDPDLPVEPTLRRATVPWSIELHGLVSDVWIERTEDDAYRELMVRLSLAEFDIIHNHSLSPIPIAQACEVAAPVVTTLHAPPLTRMVSALRRVGSHRCGHFVNISRANAEAWRRAVPNQRIVHNAVDTEFWRGGGEEKVERAVWFGRILPDKGTHYAIQAAHRAGIPIDIVGPIADQQYFASDVAPLLADSDQYLGHRTHEELCQIISRAKVAVVTPCWDEPFGLVVAEALACGTPVAGFARGGLPEILGHSVGRLAHPGHVNGLANCVQDAAQIDGNVCRRYARQTFGLERMITAYEAVYASLLEPPREPSDEALQTDSPAIAVAS